MKNAYYIDKTYKVSENLIGLNTLQTLPNIDINIKCGNSLISRFALDSDLKNALKSSKWTIDTYKLAVDTYRNATSKEEKREMERLIEDIKGNFRTEIGKNDKKVIELRKSKGELALMTTQTSMFEMGEKEKKVWKQKVEKLSDTITKLETQIEEIKSNKIYDNAFEWRFEFPEVLDDNGDFHGFDAVIGNPPYVDLKALPENEVDYLFKNYESSNNRVNLFSTFIENELKIVKSGSCICQIIPTALAFQSSYSVLRSIILETCKIDFITRLPNETFGEHVGDVKVDTLIISLTKETSINQKTKVIAYAGYDRITEINKDYADIHYDIDQSIWKNEGDCQFSIFNSPKESNIISKCLIDSRKFEECAEFCLGITPYDKYQGHTKEQIENKVFHSNHRKDDTYKPLLKGNDVMHYHVKWNTETWISYGDWLGASRDKKFFTSKRIIVKQIIDWSSKKIWSALTEEELYFSQNAFSIIPIENYSHEYLIGLLNSNLFSWYHRKVFLDEFKMRFQKILIKDCKQFPIKDCSSKVNEQFSVLVKSIINLKHNDPTADTTALESEIDQLVYQLYELTEEEIKIVEEGTK